jgi:hypothetical protein
MPNILTHSLAAITFQLTTPDFSGRFSSLYSEPSVKMAQIPIQRWKNNWGLVILR